MRFFSQKFWADKQINNFLQMEGEFENSHIDDASNMNDPEIETTEIEILQLKENNIPRGLTPLEELLNQDDVAKNPAMVPTEKGVKDVNIGAVDKLKMVKLSNSLSPEMKSKYITLMVEFSDVFAWDYLYLKVYEKNIIQHTVPVSISPKLRRINPKLLPSIEKEVNMLYESSTIVPIRFSKWMSNLVSVRKKIEEIRLCIDFRNLNKVSLKDNCPLPKMDRILHRVVGSSRMSFLDGYSGYNQILVHKDDQLKTTFITPLGTFM